MIENFLHPIFFRVKNIFIVLSRELQHLNSDNIINLAISGGLIFAFFFYISRLGFFMFGAFVLWKVSARNSILYSFDFYAGLGLITPQLEIVEITYLLLKERTLFVYNQLVELILLLVSPFVWLYKVLKRLSNYYKAKQEERSDKKAYEKYYNNDFKKQQKEQWKKEQAKQDQNNQREFRERKTKQQQKQYQQNKQSKENKQYSRWESTNPYEILGIEKTATKSEIKKAYRKLAKIYHPDLALINKDKAEEIFKKINQAYESLK